jgi:ectoine hydroxylase-related dioxygenase (phytanoyl-CoA dioxygenase family)
VNPKIIEILDRFLGPYCDNFTLSSCSITAIGPGQTPQPLHRDDMLYPLAHPSERNAVVTCFWALTDFRPENGATRLVPRSHRWDDARVPLEAETVRAVMPKGSVCIFLGSLYHGGGQNTTAQEWRIGMFAGYCLGWLRQEQNMYLTVPPEVARRLPEKLARVLGYAVHKPFLGFVQDLKDPWDYIQGYEELSEGGGDLSAAESYGVVQGRKVRVL